MARELGWAALWATTLWNGLALGQPPPAASFPEDPSPAAPASPAPVSPAPAPAPRPPAVAAEPVYAEPPEPAGRARPSRFLSLTFSPLHLLIPVFEAQGEVRIAPHFAAALIGGFGNVKVEDSDPAVDGQRFSAFELGGQLVGYPLREFDSLQLGAEVLWVHVSTDEVNGRAISADAAGVAVGPFVGYKLITRHGFTFVAQGGFQYVTARGEASDEAGNTEQAEESQFIALVNLNIGWSF